MSKIGIFWIYKSTVIGKAIALNDGVEGVPGIIDSQDNHADFWEQNREYINHFPELSGVEYYAVPRGRVLFIKKTNRVQVYLDRNLIRRESKLLISNFFEFDPGYALWKNDLHYTTSENELDNLFGD
jgi:hypothetical protein